MKFAKTLSRDEMRHIMAGGDKDPQIYPPGWIVCECYSSQGGTDFGEVSCSDDISWQTCCNAAYQNQGNTNYVHCHEQS